MPDEERKEDARKVWLGQPVWPQSLTAALLEQRSRDLLSKTRLQELGAWAVPLTAGLLYAYSVFAITPFGPLPHAAFGLGLAWSLAGLYFLNRNRSRAPWAQESTMTSGLTSGLDFCRLELMRQRDLMRRGLAWSLGPILLTLGAFVLALAMAGAQLIPNGLPFLVLIAVWIAAFVPARLREEQALRSQLEELDAIARENRFRQ